MNQAQIGSISDWRSRVLAVGCVLVAMMASFGETAGVATGVPTPFCLLALMGADYRWDPRRYLSEHLRFERFACACDRVVGLTLGLNGTALSVRKASDYLARVRPARLPALCHALRELDALIDGEESAGRFKRGDAFSKDRFQSAIRDLERTADMETGMPAPIDSIRP